MTDDPGQTHYYGDDCDPPHVPPRVQLVPAAYEVGYADGESNNAADWDMALDDILPDDVDPLPSQVAKYIDRLRAQVSAFAAEIVQAHADRDVYDSALEADLADARTGNDERDRIIIERDNEIAALWVILRRVAPGYPDNLDAVIDALRSYRVVFDRYGNRTDLDNEARKKASELIWQKHTAMFDALDALTPEAET